MLKKVLYLIFVLNTLTLGVCFSQNTILDKKITITIQNQSISSALEMIEYKAKFTFSYNNSIFEESKLITYSCTNKPLREILERILGNDYLFSLYKNQILISLKPNSTITKSSNKITQQKKNSTKQIIDTIHIKVNDTIITTITDTLFIQKVDTIVFRDTIKVPITKATIIPTSKLGFSVFYSPNSFSKTLYANKSKYNTIKNFIDNAESSYTGYDAGLQLDYTHKNFRFRIGIANTSLSKKVSYSFDKEYLDDGILYLDSIKMWKYRTIVTYYKFKDGDTVKIPVIDSSQVYNYFTHKKERIERTRVLGSNTIRLIQIPISVGYTFSINSKNTITPYLNARIYFLTYVSGFTYNSLNNSIDTLTHNNTTQCMISACLSFQYEYSVNKSSKLFIEPSLNHFISTIYSDNRNINERLFQCNITIGLKTILYNPK